MEVYYNSFRLSINLDLNEVIKLLSDFFPDIRPYCGSTKIFIAQNHYIEVNKNEDYDEIKIKNEEEDYLYYKSDIDFNVINKELTSPENEIFFSKFIKNKFIINGVKQIEILADFEHLLDE